MAQPLTLYKLIVLYMLDKATFPLSNSQISEFILDREYTSYFHLQQALSELVDAKLAKIEVVRNTSTWTPLLVKELKGLDCEIGVPIDFPFGTSDTKTKIEATKHAIKLGATAVDMVFNIGALRDHRYDFVLNEMKEHVKAAEGAVTKPILEVHFLTDDEIRAACDILIEAGATYAKSSSGQSEGPTLEQILVMRKALEGSNVKLKGGVKYPKPQNTIAFIKAGCDRIGSFEAPYLVEMFDTMREIGLVPPYTGD